MIYFLFYFYLFKFGNVGNVDATDDDILTDIAICCKFGGIVPQKRFRTTGQTVKLV